MPVEMRELYSSSNGDRWYLARDVDSVSVPTHSDQLFRLIPISCSD